MIKKFCLLSAFLVLFGAGCQEGLSSFLSSGPKINIASPAPKQWGDTASGRIVAIPAPRGEQNGSALRPAMISTIDPDDANAWPLFEYGWLGFSMKLPFEPDLVSMGSTQCVVEKEDKEMLDIEDCDASKISFPYVYQAKIQKIRRDWSSDYSAYLASVPDRFKNSIKWSFPWLTNFYRSGNVYIMGKKIFRPLAIIKRQNIPIIIFDPYADNREYSNKSYGAVFNLPDNKDSDKKFKATLITFSSDQLTFEQFIKVINTIEFAYLPPASQSERIDNSTYRYNDTVTISSDTVEVGTSAPFNKSDPAAWPRFVFKNLGFSVLLPFEKISDSNNEVDGDQCKSDFEYNNDDNLKPPPRGFCYSREYYSIPWDSLNVSFPGLGTLEASRYGTTKNEKVLIHPLKVFYRWGRTVLVFDLRQDFYPNTRFVFPNPKAETVYGIAVKPTAGGFYLRLLEVVGTLEQVDSVVKSIQFYSQ